VAIVATSGAIRHVAAIVIIAKSFERNPNISFGITILGINSNACIFFSSAFVLKFFCQLIPNKHGTEEYAEL
jgi:hypothetical protein